MNDLRQRQADLQAQQRQLAIKTLRDLSRVFAAAVIALVIGVVHTAANAGVVATGMGTSLTEATTQAKVRALEHYAGTFVIHSSTTTESAHTEKTHQYSGGVITSYKVLSTDVASNGMYTVKIDAEVAPGKNNVVSSTQLDDKFRTDLKAATGNITAQQSFAPAFNDVPIFEIQHSSVNAIARSNFVELVVNVDVLWTLKLIGDVGVYAKTAGKKVKVSSDAHDVGILAGIAAFVPGAGFFNQLKKGEPPTSAGSVVCFGRKPHGHIDACSQLPVRIEAIERKYLLVGTVTFKPGSKPLVQEQPLNDEALRSTSWRGVVLYHNGMAPNTMVFRMTPLEAERIKNVDFEIVPYKSAKVKGP